MHAVSMVTVIALAGTLPVSESTIVSGFFNKFALLNDKMACDKMFMDSLLATNATSLAKCAGLCVSKITCASLFFQLSSRKCHLCKDHHVKEPGQYPASGTRYFYRVSGTCDDSTGYRYFPSLNYCLKIYYSLSKSWMDASRHCQGDGATLIILDTVELVELFHVFLNSNGLTSMFHVGAFDDGSGWKWQNGEMVNASLWKAGQESVTNKYCSAMYKFVAMEKVDCYLDSKPFVCQKNP